MSEQQASKYRRVADNIYCMSDLVRGKKRKEPFRVHIHDKRINNKSHSYVACFETFELAKKDRDDFKRRIDLPKQYREMEEMRSLSVYTMCDEYRRNISLKRDRQSEAGIIKNFTETVTDLVSIYDYDRNRADKYTEDRKNEEYTRQGWTASKRLTLAAVDRERTILRRIWSVNKRKYPKLDNPWLGRIEGYDPQWSARQRTLEPGELDSLLEKCQTRHGKNRLYASLAIQMAVDTGLRQDEIFELRWVHINIFDRYIDMPRSKRDHKEKLPPNKIIALPVQTMYQVISLWNARFLNKPLSEMVTTDELLFVGWNKKAFRQCWWDLRNAAGIGYATTGYARGQRLQFRDLRKAAMDIFAEADLNPQEEKIMLGHSFREITEFYRSYTYRMTKLRRIREKLDRWFFGYHDRRTSEPGQTLEEILKGLGVDIEENPQDIPMHMMTFFNKGIKGFEEVPDKYILPLAD